MCFFTQEVCPLFCNPKTSISNQGGEEELMVGNPTNMSDVKILWDLRLVEKSGPKSAFQRMFEHFE